MPESNSKSKDIVVRFFPKEDMTAYELAIVLTEIGVVGPKARVIVKAEDQEVDNWKTISKHFLPYPKKWEKELQDKIKAAQSTADV